MAAKTKISSKYKPSSSEPFMNTKQKQYFKQKLLVWKETLLKGSTETITNLKEDKEVSGDFADIASAESTKSIELRTRDRERKLINKINEALKRIENYDDIRYINRITAILALEIWYRIFIKKDLNPKKML